MSSFDSNESQMDVPSPKSRKERFEDYDGFIEKFKPKKTTDDCYTPPAIYECVKEWVHENITPLDGLTIRRPFKPGGDYQAEAEGYSENDVVIDNPPFSILAKIQDFYIARGIKFFLFAPALTLFSAPRAGVTYICAHGNVVYDNGAIVRTSFLTNMEGKHRIIIAGDLCRKLGIITAQLKADQKPSKTVTKWEYPVELLTSARIGKVAEHGISFKVPFNECSFVSRLDNMAGASVFGGGYILSEKAAAGKAAAEKAAAEKAAAEESKARTVELSARERDIIHSLGTLTAGAEPSPS